MSKFKVVNLLDKLFITSCAFLLIFSWINFFIRDLWITFFLSLVFSFATLFLVFFFFNCHTKRKTNNKKYLSQIDENFLAFQVLNKFDKLKLISDILSKQVENKIKKDSIIFKKDEKNYQIMFDVNNENFNNLALFRMLEIVEKNTDILWIFCDKVDTNLNTKILKNLQVKIIGRKELYDEFFLASSIFPNNENLNTKKAKTTFKIFFKNLFTPQKTKSYFLCGLVLTFSSIILPFHTYYLIFGSLFLIFSLVCKMRKIFKF